MKLYRIYFSPTGGTKKAAELLSRGWSGKSEEVDLMAADDSRKTEFLPEDVCILAVPAFGGRVPAPAAQAVASMRGNGARAVLMAVYGNRAYEDTLTELADIAGQAGFFCGAAVAAIAEHSIVRRFAAGRPNKEDEETLEEFGQRICQYFETDNKTTPVEVPGNRPYRPYAVVFVRPEADEKCNGCGRCAALCPVQAISFKEPASPAGEGCISCMHCMAVCPQNARHPAGQAVSMIENRLEKLCAVARENELFLPQKE